MLHWIHFQYGSSITSYALIISGVTTRWIDPPPESSQSTPVMFRCSRKTRFFREDLHCRKFFLISLRAAASLFCARIGVGWERIQLLSISKGLQLVVFRWIREREERWWNSFLRMWACVSVCLGPVSMWVKTYFWQLFVFSSLFRNDWLKAF